MENFIFNPETGFMDATSYPDPSSETEAREQLMSLHSQVRDFLNMTLIPYVEALAGATGDPEAIEEIENKLNQVLQAISDIPGTADTQPTKDSTNIVQSGGTYASIENATTSIMREGVLVATNWVNGIYTINSPLIHVDAERGETNQELLPGRNITKEQLQILANAIIVDYSQAEGTMSFKALGEVPTVNIPVRVIYRGFI